MGLLPPDDLRKLHDAALSAGLAARREALLTGLDRRFAASLPLESDRSAQVLRDLATLNEAGTLADGTVPLAEWLANAAALCGDQRDAAIFEEALDRVDALAPAPPGAARSRQRRGEKLRREAGAPASPAWIVAGSVALGVLGLAGLLVAGAKLLVPASPPATGSAPLPAPPASTGANGPTVPTAPTASATGSATPVATYATGRRTAPSASASPGPASRCAGTIEMEFQKQDSSRCGQPTPSAYVDQGKLRWTLEVENGDGGKTRRSCFCTPAAP